jgi:hypothetical protein
MSVGEGQLVDRAAPWGVWDDPDTAIGMQAYAAAGFRYTSPEAVRSMDDAELLRLAGACGQLLSETYAGTYCVNLGDDEELASSVRKGETHLSVLSSTGNADESLVAMTALVDLKNKVGGPVAMSELGRSALRPVADGNGFSVPIRPMLKARVPWALANKQDTDFLVSSTRAAGEANGGISSGRGVQGVWWGGRRHGSIPMVTTAASYDYRLAGVEPFNGFVIPTDTERWKRAVPHAPVFVSDLGAKWMLNTLLTEGTEGTVRPTVVLHNPRPWGAELGFTEVSAPTDRAAGKYLITDRLDSTHDPGSMARALDEGFSQKVTLESDIASTTFGATVMSQLQNEGWTLCGWQPSEQEYGGVCPVFTRLNPAALGSLVQPKMFPEYFDAAGLRDTRRVLEGVYEKMHAEAAMRA